MAHFDKVEEPTGLEEPTDPEKPTNPDEPTESEAAVQTKPDNDGENNQNKDNGSKGSSSENNGAWYYLKEDGALAIDTVDSITKD
jgi:hypothetical protein